ncbi:MAG: mechanosensitive ion channel [Clostridia bacterium]|nr:mechanosensitive ion channel [Clostridia bacterium]
MFKNLFLTAGATDTPVEETTEQSKSFFDSVKEFFTGTGMVNFIIDVLIALVILLVGCFIVRKITKGIETGKIFPKMNKTLRVFLKHVIAVVLYIAIAVAIISILGFDMTALSAAVASAGLAIGLALQGGLSNIAGGVMLVIFKPFEVGDFIEGANVTGTVTDIGLFYTTVTSPDNKKVVVPNGIISNTDIQNYSANTTRRIDFDFSISYNASLDQAKKVLYACAKADERILDDPKPVVMITEHADSAVIIRLRVWVKTEEYWDVYFSTMEQVKRSFDEFGVEIPYPQLDVHMSK